MCSRWTSPICWGGRHDLSFLAAEAPDVPVDPAVRRGEPVKVFKAVGVCLLIEAAAVGLFWAAEQVQGTGWASVFALALLPVFGLTALPRRQRP